MAVSLYTSRVVLQALGVEDFGIYSLVAGVVVLLSFFNNALSSATQRFINFERSPNSKGEINKIFNLSVINHVLISLGILVIAETFGLWFFNSKLSIPLDRLRAANIVYQISLVNLALNILRVPFQALVIAYEKMSYYAILGVIETLLRLIAVSILVQVSTNDNLIWYTILILCVNVLVSGMHYALCRFYFRKESAFNIYRDNSKQRELLSFSSWTLLGSAAAMGAHQGLSLLLNVFFGVVVNASVGIANQVNAALYNFISSFQTAINPQIVQTYADGNLVKNRELILATSRYSFFLMTLLSAPILLFVNSVLQLWLGDNIPEYTNGFVQVILLCSLIDSLAGPFWISAAAIGKVKPYYLTIAMVHIFNLPLSYFLFDSGSDPITGFWVKVTVYLILFIYRIVFVNQVLKFSKWELIAYIVRVLSVFFFLFVLLFYSKTIGPYNLASVVIYSVVVNCFLLLFFLTLGMDRNERSFIVSIIRDKFAVSNK